MNILERKAYISRFRLELELVGESRRIQGKRPNSLTNTLLRMLDVYPEFFMYGVIKAANILAQRPARKSRKKRAKRPPVNAEYFLYFFLGREERDPVIGDLIEEYGIIQKRFSKRRADIWFYKQVAASLWPLFRRAVIKMAGLVWLGRILRRLIS